MFESSSYHRPVRLASPWRLYTDWQAGAKMEIPENAFPVLNPQQLLDLPKGRKPQDVERILRSSSSEDWVTWNFFQVMFGRYSNDWWGHFISAARRRNPN